MQMKRCRQAVSLLVCCALLAAAALFTTGCSNAQNGGGASSAGAVQETATPDPAPGAETAETAEAQPLGQGQTRFLFTVVDGDGVETVYEISTDQTTVGDALAELGLIAGEDSEYGLYVDTVDGITVDYDTDGKYWAFYVDGEYAQSGVDSTEITAGSQYSFRVE